MTSSAMSFSPWFASSRDIVTPAPPFQAWLFRIALSQISRWVRSRKWFRFWAPFDDQVIASSSETQDSEEHKRLRYGLLSTSMSIPRHFDLVLPRRSIHQIDRRRILKVEEVGTVKARLSRGRQMLKAILEQHRNQENNHKEPNHERRSIPSVLQRTQD